MHPALQSNPWSDFVALIRQVLSDPALFLGPTTGQTASLDLITAFLVAGQLLLLHRPAWRERYQKVLLGNLRLLFPVVLLINIGMMVGSIWVSGYLFAKFQTALPLESWKQLWSGLGHVAVPLMVVAVCWHQITRGSFSRLEWAAAWTAANLYWLYQLTLNTPPWLEFQQQLPVLLGTTLSGVVVSLIGNIIYLKKTPQKKGVTTRQSNALL